MIHRLGVCLIGMITHLAGTLSVMKKNFLLSSLLIFILGAFASLSYAIQGDLDASGFVDGSDLSLFSPKFGVKGVDGGVADIEKDGALDGSDLAIIASNFGQADGLGNLAAKVTWGSKRASKTPGGGRTATKAPSSVSKVKIAVSGADFSDLSSVFNAAIGRGTISGIPAGSNRTVTISGLDASGETLYRGSATVSVIAGQDTIVDIFAASVTVTSEHINPPSLFSANSIVGGVFLSWSSVSGVSGYNVYYGTVPNAYTTYTSIPGGGNQLTLPLTVQGDHYFYMTSLDSSGFESWFSSEASAPGLPSVTISSPVDGSFTNISSPFLNYSVSTGTPVVRVDGSIVFKDPGEQLDRLANGLHTVSVKTTDLAFNSWSSSVTFTVDTIAPTGSVTVEQGAYTNDPTITVTLTATDADGVAGYYLYENVATPSPPPFSVWTTFSAIPALAMSNVSYTFIFPAETNISCWFIDRAGNLSLQYNDTVIQDYVAPGNVSAGSATSLVQRVELSWTNPGDADFDGVTIRRSTTGFPATEIDGDPVMDVYSSLTSYIDDAGGAGLTLGTKYYYSLFAFDKAENYAPGFKNISAYPFQTTPMVAAGLGHSIALKSDGSVYAWGSDDYGQLGDDVAYAGKLTANNPVAALGYEGVVKIAVGFEHNLALKSDGNVFSWGDNFYGELGIMQNLTSAPLPIQVLSLSDVRDVAAGSYHSVAARNDGTVWAAGFNNNGQLGNGDNSHQDTNVFQQISGIDSVVSVAAGHWHTLALDNNGDVWGWGDNSSGQFGMSTTLYTLSDVPVFKVFSGVKAIAAGGWHSIALRNDGSIYTWGSNGAGQLGNGSTVDSDKPINIPVAGGVNVISGGLYHTAVVDSAEIVWAWGSNDFGQIGDPNVVGQTTVPNKLDSLTQPPPLFTPIDTPSNVDIVQSRGYNTIALDTNGNIWAWGNNTDGQIGNNSSGGTMNVPYKITDLTLQ